MTNSFFAVLDTDLGGFLSVLRAALILDTLRDLIVVISVHAKTRHVVRFARGRVCVGDAVLCAPYNVKYK